MFVYFSIHPAASVFDHIIKKPVEVRGITLPPCVLQMTLQLWILSRSGLLYALAFLSFGCRFISGSSVQRMLFQTSNADVSQSDLTFLFLMLMNGCDKLSIFALWSPLFMKDLLTSSSWSFFFTLYGTIRPFSAAVPSFLPRLCSTLILCWETFASVRLTCIKAPLNTCYVLTQQLGN